MELKVGDKVRIKNDLIDYKVYGACGFVSRMSMYKNKVTIITEIEGNYIYIDLDNGKWVWSKEMLEKVEEEDKVKKCKIYWMPKYVASDVQKVIVNKPCVIVFLKTGEKGIARCCSGDEFSEEQGYMIAYKRATIERLKNELEHEECILKSYVDGDFL